VVSEGRIVLVLDGMPDPAFSLTFAVRGQQLRIEQDDANKWTLTVPYQEVVV
jgi:hypothetical protein